jgi:GTP:adenosylcobinamide-phosphate guanylyltransferase
MKKNKLNLPQLHVIIQAGGRGSRLRHHTWNKPKCLISVRGKPILYHLFEQFRDAKFIIIGDYLFDQLDKFLQINPPQVTYHLLRTHGKGTASGIADALQMIPTNSPLVILWSDLIIESLPAWPKVEKPVICTTSTFTCRWTVSAEGILHEQTGAINGIPGIFYFPKASLLPIPPFKGEFVKWVSENLKEYELLDCPDLEELGDFSTVEETNNRAGFCRFFNKVEIGETQVIKSVVDNNYNELHAKEVEWYREAYKLGFRRAPKIYSENPLILERIYGQHAYQMRDLTERERRAILADYLESLIALHNLDEERSNQEEVEEVYLTKTISRVESVSRIIPGFDRESMTINGRKCRNLFSPRYKDILTQVILGLQPKRFVPIHGDATFSNTIIDDKLRVWFIDPRGYFAKPGIMGDEWYDFTKVYYSAVGGYDNFNRRKFKLHIDNETVEILMEEPLFAGTAKNIFLDYFGSDIARIEIIHGLIWLSLSGYARDDIDSVIGSFYLGLYWLEAGIQKY